ncbi:extensin-1-like [Vitis vinifera]|uniref:extensin-1-like n=1 Tax=Vitis vinifera TaxID=29760 RepID=UPI00053F45A5|nr:extensin-1-like [Vitis vinifera]
MKVVPRGAKLEHSFVCLLRLSKLRPFSVVFADIAIARTQGAKSSSPSTRLRIPRGVLVQYSTSEPPRPRLGPPPVKGAPTSPPTRRYNTRRSLTIAGASSSRGLPKKKAKVSEPIDLTESSSDPESEPTPSPPPVEKSPPPTKRSPWLAKKSPPPTKKP